MEKVTIAIALYNNASYIERCIQSVLDQSYQDIEVIIVDDGSTDNSIEKCKIFLNDKRIRLITKDNGGLSSARQRALQEATGEYICFIDADDYLKQDHVAIMKNKLETTKADMCLCSVRFEDSDGNEVCNQPFNEVESIKPLVLSKENLANNFHVFRNKLKLSDSWNKMYRKSFIKKHDIQFEHPKGFNGSDTVFNHKLVLHTPICVSVSDMTYVHVIYKSSAVHRKNRKLYEGSMFIFDQIYSECIKCDVLTLMEEQLSILFMMFVRNGMQDVFNEKTYDESNKKIMKDSKEKIHSYKLNLKACKLPEKGLKLFYLLYQYCPILLKSYLSIRQKKLIS